MLGFGRRRTTLGEMGDRLRGLAELRSPVRDLGEVRSRLRDLGERVRTRDLRAGLSRLGVPAGAGTRPLTGLMGTGRRGPGTGRLAVAAFGGAFVGAALMYLFDPEAGRRRRAVVRERLGWYVGRTTEAVDETSREVMARTRGLVVEMRDRLRGEPRPDGGAEEVRAPEAR
ncbi:MAG TPA: hypothetical protein VNO23_17135 [Candidatus Binatia bacterium]|nr:hypothetical protein [Candidatus Binatia bacterium]